MVLVGRFQHWPQWFTIGTMASESGHTKTLFKVTAGVSWDRTSPSWQFLPRKEGCGQRVVVLGRGGLGCRRHVSCFILLGTALCEGAVMQVCSLGAWTFVPSPQ